MGHLTFDIEEANSPATASPHQIYWLRLDCGGILTVQGVA